MDSRLEGEIEVFGLEKAGNGSELPWSSDKDFMARRGKSLPCSANDWSPEKFAGHRQKAARHSKLRIAGQDSL
jgi:hypothetical protein